MALIDDIRNVRIADYDYALPDERIAKHPLAPQYSAMNSTSCSPR